MAALQQLLERPKHGVRAVVVVKTAVVRWFWLRPVGYHPWGGPGADNYGGRGQTSEIPRFVTATIGLGAVGAWPVSSSDPRPTATRQLLGTVPNPQPGYLCTGFTCPREKAS